MEKIIFSLFLTFVLTVGKAQERRLALVIGNSNYSNIEVLVNPLNDAKAMEEVLKKCNFEVILLENANKRTIDTKVREFTELLKDYDTGLFFYAGHGMEINGTNYVVPTDVTGNITESDVEYDCVNTNWIQQKMSEAGAFNKTNILILDACRNNPFRKFKKRDIAGSAWTSPTDVPTGIITCYAASQGEYASDGAGQNGLYTSILIKHILTPDISIEDVFKKVRIELLQKGGQKPIETTSLTTDFYFVKTKEGQVKSTPNLQAKGEVAVAEKPKIIEAKPKPSADVAQQNTTKSAPIAVVKQPAQKPIEVDKKEQITEKEAKFIAKKIENKPDTVNKKAIEVEVINEEFVEDNINAAFTMQKIKGGEFMMGSQIPESGKDEMPHKVRIPKPYFIGKTEVTNAEFCQFLNEKGNQIEGGVTWIDLNGIWDDEKCRIYQKNKSFFVETSYENYPVIYVSWYGATAYCKWLSEKTGKNYRLPTEAEWEFAATNGEKHTKFSWGDGAPVGSVGNVCDETARTKYDSWSAFPDYTDGYIYTSPVATYEPNEFGLHDMTGNVWEWCSDWYDKPYYNYSPIENPTGATSGTNRVIRGGSWFNYPKRCRAANRSDNTPDARDGDLGFRVALSPE